MIAHTYSHHANSHVLPVLQSIRGGECLSSRKVTLAYLSLLLVTLSTEIELNPGPFACGSCGIEVLDEDAAVSCDNRDLWYHIQCQDISFGTYESHQADDMFFAWVCLNCEAQNYSTNSNPSLTSFLSENSFSGLTLR